MRIAIAVLAAGIILISGSTTHAAVASDWILTGYIPAVGYPAECGKTVANAGASSPFTETRAFVNWGGFCNLGNGRPAGWLKTTMTQYDSFGNLLVHTGAAVNPAGSSVASIPGPFRTYAPATSFICGKGDYWKSSPGSWVSRSVCAAR